MRVAPIPVMLFVRREDALPMSNTRYTTDQKARGLNILQERIRTMEHRRIFITKDPGLTL